jgi:hypothetical protein
MYFFQEFKPERFEGDKHHKMDVNFFKAIIFQVRMTDLFIRQKTSHLKGR